MMISKYFHTAVVITMYSFKILCMSQINWKLHSTLNAEYIQRGMLSIKPQRWSSSLLSTEYTSNSDENHVIGLFWTTGVCFSEIDLQRPTSGCICGGFQIYFRRNICCCSCWLFEQVSLTEITIICLLFTFEGVLGDRMFDVSSHFFSFHLVLAAALRTQEFEKKVKRDENLLVFMF